MSLVSLQFSSEQIAAKQLEVRARALRVSPYVRQGNFIKISPLDLLALYRAYDEVFFQGQMQKLVGSCAPEGIDFRVSRAMTSSGGRTTWYRRGGRTSRFVISIAVSLLFNSFSQDQRPIHVSGKVCLDRLDALMRIMEHELVHLLEMLVFGNSSCSRTRFMTIAGRLFGHTHAKHQLVTAQEHAAREHQIRVGQQVRFVYEQKEHIGVVNRVGLRATVLVPDPRGRRYSDGRHYAKFLIPPARLTPVG